MATDIAEWRPLTELRHRVDQMFRDVAGENGKHEEETEHYVRRERHRGGAFSRSPNQE